MSGVGRVKGGRLECGVGKKFIRIFEKVRVSAPLLNPL